MRKLAPRQVTSVDVSVLDLQIARQIRDPKASRTYRNHDLCPAVDALMQRARDYALGIQLPGTPTLVVNGKYLVTGSSHAEQLRIVDDLIAQLRATR